MLNKALYDLKQVPRAWFYQFTYFIRSTRFQNRLCDPSHFIYKHNSAIIILLLYADDILLTTSLTNLLQSLIQTFKFAFSMNDLGLVNISWCFYNCWWRRVILYLSPNM